MSRKRSDKPTASRGNNRHDSWRNDRERRVALCLPAAVISRYPASWAPQEMDFGPGKH